MKIAGKPSAPELARLKKAEDAAPYSPDGSYAAGAYVLHKTYGLGWVAEADERITVIFEDGVRVLAHVTKRTSDAAHGAITDEFTSTGVVTPFASSTNQK